MRYALYYTPPPGDPLTLVAQSWLGRDAFTGEAVEPIVPHGFTGEEFRSLTCEPRRYGFHATLVAPFRLRADLTEADLSGAADAFAERVPSFTVSDFAITRIGSFFALTLNDASRVSALASAAVDHFDGLRTPLTEAEIARRKPDLLSKRQRLYLHRHGYPYVKDEFRFHMTLTGPVEAQAAPRVRAVLQDHFGALLSRPIDISTVALFVEPTQGADFVVHSMHRLGAVEARKYA